MRPKKKATPLRAEILSEERTDESEEEDDEIIQRKSLSVPSSSLSDIFHIHKPRYGFMNSFVGVFSDLVRDGLAVEMIQLPNPDETPQSERRSMRIAAEQEKFDPDRFLGDIDIEDDYIYQIATSMQPHWSSSSDSIDALTEKMSLMTTKKEEEKNIIVRLSTSEQAALASIAYPILDTSIEDAQKQHLLLGLSDMLFAYTYDHLLTDGEATTESSWTICTLSCTLSWLDEFTTAEDVVRSSIRRSLIYPYIRNYEFAVHCWEQVRNILFRGRRCVIRCLLQVRQILEKSEVHYLGNKLYLDPYLAFLQNNRLISDDGLLDLGKMVSEEVSCCTKEALQLNLVEIEQLLYEDDDVSDDEISRQDCQSSDDDDDEEDRNSFEEHNASHEKKTLEILEDPKSILSEFCPQQEESSSNKEKRGKPLIVELD